MLPGLKLHSRGQENIFVKTRKYRFFLRFFHSTKAWCWSVLFIKTSALMDNEIRTRFRLDDKSNQPEVRMHYFSYELSVLMNLVNCR